MLKPTALPSLPGVVVSVFKFAFLDKFLSNNRIVRDYYHYHYLLAICQLMRYFLWSRYILDQIFFVQQLASPTPLYHLTTTLPPTYHYLITTLWLTLSPPYHSPYHHLNTTLSATLSTPYQHLITTLLPTLSPPYHHLITILSPPYHHLINHLITHPLVL